MKGRTGIKSMPRADIAIDFNQRPLNARQGACMRMPYHHSAALQDDKRVVLLVFCGPGASLSPPFSPH